LLTTGLGKKLLVLFSAENDRKFSCLFRAEDELLFSALVSFSAEKVNPFSIRLLLGGYLG